MSTTITRWMIAGVFAVALMGALAVSLREHDRSAVKPAAVSDDSDDVIPHFLFVERSGRNVSRGDLDGHPWIVDFIFTRCAEHCPALSSRMAAIQSALTPEDSVRLVSVSVDPEHDTPAVLSSYAERYGADPERWLFLTGDRRAVYSWIRKGFHLGVESASDGRRITGARNVIHSDRLVLVDGTGRIRGSYDAMEIGVVERVLIDLRSLAGAAR